MILQKVDIRGTFCYTTELVAPASGGGGKGSSVGGRKSTTSTILMDGVLEEDGIVANLSSLENSKGLSSSASSGNVAEGAPRDSPGTVTKKAPRVVPRSMAVDKLLIKDPYQSKVVCSRSAAELIRKEKFAKKTTRKTTAAIPSSIAGRKTTAGTVFNNSSSAGGGVAKRVDGGAHAFLNPTTKSGGVLTTPRGPPDRERRTGSDGPGAMSPLMNPTMLSTIVSSEEMNGLLGL